MLDLTSQWQLDRINAALGNCDVITKAAFWYHRDLSHHFHVIIPMWHATRLTPARCTVTLQWSILPLKCWGCSAKTVSSQCYAISESAPRWHHNRPGFIVIRRFDMQLTVLHCDNRVLWSWCCTVHPQPSILPSWVRILRHKAPFPITHSALVPNALFQITIVSERTCVLQCAPLYTLDLAQTTLKHQFPNRN